MKIVIGKTYFSLLFNYKGHGKKFGVLNFKNGQTLRFYRVALHIWRPSERNWRPFGASKPKNNI